MKKIVINKRHGGFNLSHEAVMCYAELKGIKLYYENRGLSDMYYFVPVEYYNIKNEEAKKTKNYKEVNQLIFFPRNIARDDEKLIQVVEELKEKANGKYSDLKIVEIPNDVSWQIEEYDGKEWIAETHRVWS